MKIRLFSALALLLATTFLGCGTTQSLMKSSFPYKTTLSIPASSTAGKEYTALSRATSFDQSFTRDGNNAYKINNVTISSGSLKVDAPDGYKLGNLEWVKIYVSKDDGSDESLVAYRTDIGPDAGRSIVLETDSKVAMDKLVRQPNIRVRMVYKVRNGFDTDATLRLSLSMSAHAAD